MPTVDAVKLLASVSATAPSADNYQPWCFSWDGNQLSINYDTQRVGGTTFAHNNPGTLLGFGAILENLYSLAATSGFKISVTLFPTKNVEETIANVEFSGEGLPHSYPADHPVRNRHTNRFRYQKKRIPASILEPIAAMREGSARLSVYRQPEHLTALRDLVKRASLVRFRTRDVHEMLAACLRFNEQEVSLGDGLDVRSLDLPPGGAQFLKFSADWRRISLLNKIGAHRFMAQVDSAPIKDSPAAIAFFGEATQSGAIETGRLITRTWITLNAQGVAVHPYYVVTDQLTRLAEGKVPHELEGEVRQLKTSSEHLFELAPTETLYMLLRIGYPTRDPQRSLRLPIDRLFTDLTTK
jgi:hypothetical protein